MHLNAAREFGGRVPFAQLLKFRVLGLDQDDPDPVDLVDVDFWASHLSSLPAFVGTPAQVAADARNFQELEALVLALDTMETLASLGQISREYVFIAFRANLLARLTIILTIIRESEKPRDLWTKVGVETKALKECMRPLLGGWLVGGIQGKHSNGADPSRQAQENHLTYPCRWRLRLGAVTTGVPP